MIVCVTIVDSIMMDGYHHHHPPHPVPPWSLGNHTIAFVVAARTVSTYEKILIPGVGFEIRLPGLLFYGLLQE